MKLIYFFILISFSSITLSAQAMVSSTELSTTDVVKRAVKYLHQRDCRNALTYLSSPKLKNTHKYDSFKYYRAKCYFFLHEYAKSQLIIGLVNKEKLSRSLKAKAAKLEKDLDQIVYSRHKRVKSPWFISLGGYTGTVKFDSNTDREKGTFVGAFGIVAKKQFVFEGGFQKYNLKYKSTSTKEKYSQNGSYFGYSHINPSNTDKYRYFINYVKGSTSDSLNTLALLYGYKHYFGYNHFLGFNLSVNSYSIPSNIIQSFKSAQISPVYKRALGHNFFFSGDVNISINTYKSYAQTTTSPAFNTRYSSDLSLGYEKINFGFNISAMFGKENFMLKSEGLVVQNYTDSVTSSLAVGTRYSLTKNITFSAKYQNYKFKDETYGKTFAANSITGYLTLTI